MPASCERRARGDEVRGLGDDLEATALVDDLLGARVEHGEEDVVLGHAVGLGDRDDALAVEVVGDAARIGHRAAVARHQGAHLGRGAVLVVGEALDEQGDAVRAVALVHDRLVVDRLAARSPRRA